ncbi:MAG TPA: hypothetical protein VGB82_15880 [Alphaproteobacteria bacterium]
MSPLPRVTAQGRERICREFDDRGPEACVTEILDDLERSNPEFLKLAERCAAGLRRIPKFLTGFAMFYRLLVQQWPVRDWRLSPLPRVTAETCRRVIEKLRERGSEPFIAGAVEALECDNPELLVMVDGFAHRHNDYLALMQAFLVLYEVLVLQSEADRLSLH